MSCSQECEGSDYTASKVLIKTSCLPDSLLIFFPICWLDIDTYVWITAESLPAWESG